MMMMMMTTTTAANIYLSIYVDKGSRERDVGGKKKKKTTSVACAHTRIIIIRPFDIVEKGKSVHIENARNFLFSYK
jgi:hypothetical protein